MKLSMRTLILALIAFLVNFSFGFSQNTEQLFSQKGLKFIADIYDDTNQFFDGSLFYVGDTVIENNKLLMYETKYGGFNYLQVENKKVYNTDLNLINKVILFDFGLNIGDTFVLKIFGIDTFIVNQKNILKLDDGLERIQITLKHKKQNWTLKWIEGIGFSQSGISLSYNSSVNLICVSNDQNGLIYKGDKFDEEKCSSRSCRYLTANFSINGFENKINLQNNSKNYNTVSWDFDDGNFSSFINAEHEYLNTGCYRILLTTYNECGEKAQFEKYYNYCTDSLWIKINPATFGKISFVDERKGWAITSENVFHTEDGGKTWISQSIPTAESPTKIRLHTIHMVNDTIGVIVNLSKDYTNLLLTKNGGISWEKITTGDQGTCFAKIFENGVIITASNGKVSISNDFGLSWTDTKKPRSFIGNDLKITGNQLITFIGGGISSHTFPGLIHISKDLGLTWKEIRVDEKYIIENAHFFNEEKGVTVGKHFILKTDDGGNSWREVFEFVNNEFFYDVDFSDELNGIAVTKNHILRTFDGGESWNIEYCQNKNIITNLEIINEEAYLSTQSGFFQRKVNDDFDCTTGVNYESFNKVVIFPTPALNTLNIKLFKLSYCKIKILDINGRTVLQTNVLDDTQLDLSILTSGIYFIHIYDHEKIMFVEKLIKI